jgi:hypothetical protein
MSLNAIARPATLEPGPLVVRGLVLELRRHQNGLACISDDQVGTARARRQRVVVEHAARQVPIADHLFEPFLHCPDQVSFCAGAASPRYLLLGYE